MDADPWPSCVLRTSGWCGATHGAQTPGNTGLLELVWIWWCWAALAERDAWDGEGRAMYSWQR